MIPHHLRNPKLLRLVVIIAAVVGVFAAAPWTDGAQANDSDSAIGLLAVDVDTAGNTATSLGPTEACVRVEPGASAAVDVVVDAIPTDRPLTAFQFDLLYDPAIVNVAANDVVMLLASNAGSDPYNVSESAPDSDGDFLVAVLDAGFSPGETGPGVLSRLTLTTVGSGVTTLTLAQILVLDNENREIPITALASALLAVGQDCPSAVPTPIITSPGTQPPPDAQPDQEPGEDTAQGTETPGTATPGAEGTPIILPETTSTPSASPETPGRPGTPAAGGAGIDSGDDSDGDGVCNRDAPSSGPSGCTGSDQCPDTPAGASVDASGCSATQLEQLKEEAKAVLTETATPHLNLGATLDTVTVGGSTDVLALFVDENNEPVPGVDITFKIDQQPGNNANLDGETSVTKASDTDGIVEAKLNVGDTPGKIVVSTTADGETETITITVEAGRTGNDGGDDGVGAWIAAPIAAVVLALLAAGYVGFRRIRGRAK